MGKKKFDDETEEMKIIKDYPVEDKIKYGYNLTKEDVLSQEGLLLVQCLSREGATLQEIADKFGVSLQAFWGWRKKNPELDNACRKGKELVNYEVENALLKAALGYRYTTVKTIIEIPKGSKELVKTKIEKTETEVQPSVTACLAWLNNRASNRWHRTNGNEIVVDDDENNITINIIKGGKIEGGENEE